MKHIFPMQQYLSVIKGFQDKYPTAHVGGSIGLFLRGIDLKRELGKSDIDMTIDFIPSDFHVDNLEESSEKHDFSNTFRAWDKDGRYIKVDLRESPEPSFDVINFEGVDYNVSKLRDIIWWKTKYANKGIEKHKHDLIVINGGERPSTSASYNTYFGNDEDLPF